MLWHGLCDIDKFRKVTLQGYFLISNIAYDTTIASSISAVACVRNKKK